MIVCEYKLDDIENNLKQFFALFIQVFIRLYFFIYFQIFNFQHSNILSFMDDRRYERKPASPSQKIYISNLNMDVGTF
jgi:hypothetical protein